MPQESPPDIVLLGAEWHPRALIRAQLIEEGFDVEATHLADDAAPPQARIEAATRDRRLEEASPIRRTF